MPYSIQTKDGIKINNIPDDVAPDSDILKQRVAAERSKKVGAVPAGTESVPDPKGEVPLPYGEKYPEPEQAPTPGIGERISGSVQALGTLASGATMGTLGYAGGLLGGIAGSVASGDFGTPEAAQRIAQSAQEGSQRLTIQPITAEGRRQVKAVGEALAPVAGVVSAVAPMAGEMAALASGARQLAPAIKDIGRKPTPEAPRMPVARAPAALIDQNTGYPTAAFEKALKAEGVTLEGVIDDIPRLPQTMAPSRAARELVIRKLRAGDRDPFLATKQLLPGNKVVDDTLAQAAVKQGFREGDVQAVKVAEPGTRRGMAEMLRIKREIYGNERKALDMRPSDVIGNATIRRVDHIRTVANRTRQELDDIAKTALPGQKVNVDAVRENLFKEFDRLDIDYDPNSFLGKPSDYNFAGSMIAKDRTSQRVIKDVVDLLAADKAPDALRAHKLKRQLDTMIDFRSRDAGGLTEAGENIARAMRRSLNDVIREVSPEYASVNDTLSASIGALDDLQRAMGPSIDIRNPGANKAIGQDLRSLMSNNKTRVKLDNAVTQLDDVARELGGTFDDDLRDLVLFDKTLDERFGATARRGFSGEIESGVGRVMQGREGLKKAVIEKAEEKLNEMRNVNDYQAFKTLDELIKRK